MIIRTLAQVCNLCLVLKKQSILPFCSNEQHTDYKSARAELEIDTNTKTN